MLKYLIREKAYIVKEDLKRMNPQKIVQLLEAINNYQACLAVRVNEADQEQMQKLKRLLAPQIDAWGGLDAIELWLKENEPEFDVPSEIRGMDWSWLNSQ